MLGLGHAFGLSSITFVDSDIIIANQYIIRLIALPELFRSENQMPRDPVYILEILADKLSDSS